MEKIGRQGQGQEYHRKRVTNMIHLEIIRTRQEDRDKDRKTTDTRVINKTHIGRLWTCRETGTLTTIKTQTGRNTETVSRSEKVVTKMYKAYRERLREFIKQSIANICTFTNKITSK